MSKTTKTWLITATVLVLIGIFAFAGVMASYDFDFTRLSTVHYTTNTYEVSEEFNKISIDVDTSVIEFVLSEGDECRIVCTETEKVTHSAAVQDGTLVIDIIDTRKWFDHICISIGTPKMTVYLPQNEYISLFIETDTGDITIPKEFTFDNLEIHGDTSDVEFFASVSNKMEIDLSTGDIQTDNFTAGLLSLTTTTGAIQVNAVTAKGDIDIKTDTGKIQLTDVSCANFSAESDTGTINLKRVIAAGSFTIDTDTGDVRLDGSDAAEISVKTSTGDVTGTLLSEKIFFTETSTGRISVPKTTSGGKCEIQTSTGDIEITMD